jgi:AmmeMemoRadiSam system protein B
MGFLVAASYFLEWEGLKMANASEKVTRQAYGSGRWFPGNSRELREMVESYMENAHPGTVEGRIVAAIAPHAGYVYSGKVAGFTFRAIKDNAEKLGSPETVVVLGFSHRGGFPGVAIMDGDRIETPLGEAALDKEAGEILTAASPRIFFDYGPHRGEHSAENQIPFLQVALPGTKLVVALMGDHDSETLAALVKALDGLSQRKRLLVVASTDMLHDPDYDLVGKTDEMTLKKLARMDWEGLQKTWGYENQILCGIGPVLTAIKFARRRAEKRGPCSTTATAGMIFRKAAAVGWSATDRWFLPWIEVSGNEMIQDSGRPVHFVFRLLPYDGLGPFDDVIGDFLSPVGGEAMHDPGIFRRHFQ